MIAESEFADHQISFSAAVSSIRRGDVEQRHVLTGEAGVGAVLVDRGGPHGEWAAERADRLKDLSSQVLLTRGNRLDEVPREREAGRDRQPRPGRVSETHSLRAELGGVPRLLQPD